MPSVQLDLKSHENRQNRSPATNEATGYTLIHQTTITTHSEATVCAVHAKVARYEGAVAEP